MRSGRIRFGRSERSGFESRPYSQLSRQRDAAAACPPFDRDKVGSTPTAGTEPGFVQRQDLRPITGESGWVITLRVIHRVSTPRCAEHRDSESSSLDHVDEVLLAARLPRKQEDRVRPPASAPFRPAS